MSAAVGRAAEALQPEVGVTHFRIDAKQSVRLRTHRARCLALAQPKTAKVSADPETPLFAFALASTNRESELHLPPTSSDLIFAQSGE